MTLDSPEASDSSDRSSDAEIDALRDRFEAAWISDQQATIEKYLQELAKPARPAALLELIKVEVEIRRERGESPVADEYHRRFPAAIDPISDIFSLVEQQAIETIIPTPAGQETLLRVRCPQCHSPIELATDVELSGVDCPHCNNSFSLTGGDNPKAARSLQRVAHFELIERLGMGAFGSVWKARDTQLDRIVAIKIPLRGNLDDRESEMFLREARTAAQLKHPNIVSVHEVGRDAMREGGMVFIVSDLVEGEALNRWIVSQQLTSREAAELCATVAEALHYAHQHGVIHRDLKPQNILIDKDGEPHITDFGLAKRDVGEITMTMEGQIVGTPAYMSPEQARGASHDADARSDVYSLGVVLFQLLTSELPFRGSARMLLKQVLEDDPPSLHRLNSSVPKDLETICLKCMEKQPNRRYETADAVAADFGRFLKGEVINARPIGRVGRAWRWCNRNRLVATLTAVVISSVVSITIVTTVGYVSTSRALQERDEAATAAERVSEFLTDLFRASDPVGFASGDNFEFSKQDDNASSVTTQVLLSRGAERIERELDDQPGVQATLMDSIGGVYRAIGLFEDAIHLLKKSLNLRQTVLERDDQKIAATMQNLGLSLYYFGQLDEAEQYYRESLRLRRQHFGEEHLEVTATMYSLALLLATSGRLDEATDKMQQVIAIRRKLSGDKSQSVAIGLAGLAAIYLSGGKEEEAQSVIAEAYLIFRDNAGNTASSQVLMDLLQGIQASHQGKYFEAVPLLANSLQTGTDMLGGAHPFVAWCKAEYGRALEGLGRYDEAESNYRDAIEIADNAVGLQHISVILVRYQLAQILQKTNRFEAAEETLKTLIEDVRQVHGSGSSELAYVIDNLADLQRSEGRFEQSEDSSREALRIARIAFQDDIAKIPLFLRQLARSLISQGRTDEAIVLLQESLALEAEVETNDKNRIGKSLQLLAEALTQSDQAGQAERLLRRAWRTALDDSNQTNEDHARLEYLLGSWLVSQQRYDEAEKHLLSSYSVIEENLDEDHAWIRENRGKLRSLYQQWNKPEELAKYDDDDHSISPTISPPETVDSAR